MKRKIRLTEGDLHRIVRQCVNEAINIDPKQRVRLAKILLDKAYDIQNIITRMTDNNGHSRNYLAEWIEGEEWFKRLQSATFDMIYFAKDNLNEPNYGPYEDDPII